MLTVIKKGIAKEQLELLWKELNTRKARKSLDAWKHCGVLALEEDALSIQKRLRDEWE